MAGFDTISYLLGKSGGSSSGGGNSSSGGSSTTTYEGKVIFIDYDGTVLHEYTAAQFNNLSSLPANPTHIGLTAQGWNWTQQEIITQLTAMPEQDVIVGQLYVTDDGKTRLYITVTDGLRVCVMIATSVKQSTEINWGDGATSTSTTSISATAYYHTYEAGGDYVITLAASSGTIQFGTTSSTSYNVLGSASTTNMHARSILTRVELGNNIIFTRYSLTFCYNLTTITVPNDFQIIDSTSTGHTFYNCFNLKSITFPRTITMAQINMFKDDVALTACSLPPTITELKASCFNSCFNLSLITIPNSVTTIGENAFNQCAALKLYTLPASLTSLGNSAFAYCQNLTSMKLPSSLTSLPNQCFYWAWNLTDITIPSSITSFIASFPYTNLTSITIPGNISTLNSYVFQGCRGLKEVKFLTNNNIALSDITGSGSGAFYECSSLEKIIMPEGVGFAALTKNAFYNCYHLQSISLANTITDIPESAFNYNQSLKTITIPANVTNIGMNAFNYCKSLETITILSTVLTSLGNNAFAYCHKLKSINLSATSISTIPQNAFFYDYSLKTVLLPNSTTSIGQAAFQDCHSLQSINLPSLITTISGNAFYQCYSLQSITLPSSLTNIGASAFYNCNSARGSITIPSSVTNIGNNAFSSCVLITEFHILSETPPTLGTSVFLNINENCKIYVPYSADHSILSAYQSATNWSTYASKMVEEDPS